MASGEVGERCWFPLMRMFGVLLGQCCDGGAVVGGVAGFLGGGRVLLGQCCDGGAVVGGVAGFLGVAGSCWDSVAMCGAVVGGWLGVDWGGKLFADDETGTRRHYLPPAFYFQSVRFQSVRILCEKDCVYGFIIITNFALKIEVPEHSNCRLVPY